MNIIKIFLVRTRKRNLSLIMLGLFLVRSFDL